MTQHYYCNPSQGSSSSSRVSRRSRSCHKPISGLHKYDQTKTSAAATSSPILRAALSRSLAKGWLEMSILRQSEQSSNSSQEVSQSIGRRLRGKPNHVVFHLSSKSTFRFSVEFSLDISGSYRFLVPTHDSASKLVVFAKARSKRNFAWANRIVCTDQRIADSSYLA